MNNKPVTPLAGHWDSFIHTFIYKYFQPNRINFFQLLAVYSSVLKLRRNYTSSKVSCCQLYRVSKALYVNILKDHMVIMQFTTSSAFKVHELQKNVSKKWLRLWHFDFLPILQREVQPPKPCSVPVNTLFTSSHITAVLQVSLMNAPNNLSSILPKQNKTPPMHHSIIPTSHPSFFLSTNPRTVFTQTTPSHCVPSSYFLQRPNKLICLFIKTEEIQSRYFLKSQILNRHTTIKISTVTPPQHQCSRDTLQDNRSLIKR